MKEFIEKLIGRLEEEIENVIVKDTYTRGKNAGLRKAEVIVNQLAEEYINCSTDTSTNTSSGWIPCSERLPGNISTVLVQVKEIEKPTLGWFGNMDGWRLVEKDFVDFKEFTIIAWMPLPPAYVPKEGRE